LHAGILQVFPMRNSIEYGPRFGNSVSMKTDGGGMRIQERWKQADIEREQVERVRRERAQKTADWILRRAKPVQSHPYLERKAVRPYGALRE